MSFAPTITSKRWPWPSGPTMYKVHIPVEGLGVRRTTKTFSSRDAADDWLRANLVRVHAEVLASQQQRLIAADTKLRKHHRALRARTRKLFEERLRCELAQQVLCFTIQPPSELGEVWRWIAGQHGKYRVSTYGRVWSQPRDRSHKGGLLTGTIGPNDYRRVNFGVRKSRPIAVHKLVLTAFDGPRPKGLVARHLDGNPLNNHRTNLKWGTHKENALDRVWHEHCRRNNLPKEQYVRPTTAVDAD